MKLKTLYQRYRFELIAAGAGAIVMIFELVGARMIAPYFGTSLYVWTAVIGVILGALAFGYWYGGKLADKKATNEGLMQIISIAAICISVTMLLQEPLLQLLAITIADVRISALLASLILFAPAAILLGIVSPYIVRMKLASLKTAGAAVGRLSAAGTFGSIVGTFLAGYWLISWFGNRQLGIALVLALIALSFMAAHRGWYVQRSLIVVFALLVLGGMTPLSQRVIADVDSAYSRYLVTETGGGTPVRNLLMDPFGVQSAQYVGDPDTLLFDYTKRFMDVVRAQDPNDILVIGGGAFTFPLAAARAEPRLDVTAVEIDPKLTDIASEYFSLRPYPNLEIVNEDGRVFLNRSQDVRKYDVIYMDAFSALTPPYQLTTTEAVARAKTLLTQNGPMVVNIIASVRDSPYLSAVYATYSDHFRHVAVYRYNSESDLSESQNLLIVATDDTGTSKNLSKTLDLEPVTVQKAGVLTDDFAPVEQLIQRQ